MIAIPHTGWTCLACGFAMFTSGSPKQGRLTAQCTGPDCVERGKAYFLPVFELHPVSNEQEQAEKR